MIKKDRDDPEMQSLVADDQYTPSKDAFKKLVVSKPLLVDDYSPQFWRLSVLAITIFWSTNFPIIKLMYAAVPSMSSSLYYASRFPIATSLFLPQMLAKSYSKKLVLKSFFCGIVISLAYMGQGVFSISLLSLLSLLSFLPFHDYQYCVIR